MAFGLQCPGGLCLRRPEEFELAVSIVEDYWAGVVQRLEAEVHVFAQLVTHEGERGRENESVLARILESLVPGRYGIGSGLLFDSEDNYSRQTDIVVYDQSDEPAILAQTTQLLFPVESVLACIEVKTTLRGDDVDDCLRKAEDMRALSAAREFPDGSSHPLFVVLAYRAGQLPKTLVSKFMEANEAQRPDLVCIVGQGILMGAHDSIRERNNEPFAAGLALLRDGDGEPIAGEAKGPEMLAVHEGRQFPLVKYAGSQLLVEPSRALLLFVEALVRILALKQGHRAPVLSLYVGSDMRQLAWYNAEGEPV